MLELRDRQSGRSGESSQSACVVPLRPRGDEIEGVGIFRRQSSEVSKAGNGREDVLGRS